MKNRRKQIVALFIATILLMASIPLTTFAASITIQSYPQNDKIYNTNAEIWARVDKPSNSSVSKIGCTVWEANGVDYRSVEMAPSKNYVGSKVMYPWFNITTEVGMTLQPGTTYNYTIYAVVDGQTYSTTILSFTTTGTKTINASSISINPTNMTMNVGDIQYFSVTVNPSDATNKDYYLTSSDSSVVSYDYTGKVVALKSGSTVITATSISGGHTASCYVTVNDNKPATIIPENTTVKVSGIAINPENITMNIGEKKTFSVTISPSNATNKNYTLMGGDSIISWDYNGNITALKAGTTTITATSDEGYITICTITVKQSDIIYNLNDIKTDKLYYIRNVKSQKVLDIYATKKNEGTQIHLWEQISGHPSQLFKFEKSTSKPNSYKLFSPYSGKYISVKDNSKSKGAAIQIFSNKEYRYWVIESAGDGVFKFKNYDSNLYLDIKDGIFNDGTILHQWTSNSTDAQLFEIVEYNVDTKSDLTSIETYDQKDIIIEKTITEGGQVVDSFKGVESKYYKDFPGGTSTKEEYNCAWYVRKFYEQLYNINIYNLYQSTTPKVKNNNNEILQCTIEKIQVKEKGDLKKLSPGDIVRLTNSNHWAIIKKVNEDSIILIEQNFMVSKNKTRINRVIYYDKDQPYNDSLKTRNAAYFKVNITFK